MAARPARVLNSLSFAELASFAYTAFASLETLQQRTASKLARRALAVSVFFIVLVALPSLAKTFTVTDTSDNGADPNSLRYAVNNAGNGDTINFNLTYPATIRLTNGYIEIKTDVTINGPGATNLFISGNNTSAVFQIDPTVTGVGAAISGVTIKDGLSSGFLGGGGGIYNEGTLTLDYSTVSDNLIGNDGGGGGIFNAGTLTVSNSTVLDNQAGGGGGIYNTSTLAVSNSTIAGNDSYDGDGGGILNAGTLTVLNSTIAGNSACCDALGGGGLLNRGAATVSFSTFANNVGAQVPGSGTGAIVSFGTLTLKGAILALSDSYDGNCNVQGGTSGGYNLSDDSTCTFLTATGDQNNVATAGLSPSGLQNNGGPTQTIALLPTSPAVNAIPVSPTNQCTDAFGSPVKTDQRGVTRPQGSGCDIGAFELVNAQLTASTSSLTFNDLAVHLTFTKQILLRNSGPSKVMIGTASITPTSGDPAAFSVWEFCEPRTLNAGRECVIAITFEPTQLGLSTATLNIPSTAPGSPLQVALSGTGINRKK